MSTWQFLEDDFRVFLKSVEPRLENTPRVLIAQGRPTKGLLGSMTAVGVLPDSLAQSITTFKDLRNKVAHGLALPTEGEAAAFYEAAIKIMVSLRVLGDLYSDEDPEPND